MAPKPKAFWPLTIVSGGNDRIDFTVGATPYVATVAPGTYYDPVEVATQVTAALEGSGYAGAVDCSVSSSGFVTLLFEDAAAIQFATGTNAARSIHDVLGFPHANRNAATTHLAPYQHQNGWYADRAVEYDGKPFFRRLTAQTVAQSGAVKDVDFGEQELRSISLAMLPPHKTKVSREGAATNEAIERLWRDGSSRFRWWPDASDMWSYVDLRLDNDSRKEFNPKRYSAGKEAYSLTWLLRRYV